MKNAQFMPGIAVVYYLQTGRQRQNTVCNNIITLKYSLTEISQDIASLIGADLYVWICPQLLEHVFECTHSKINLAILIHVKSYVTAQKILQGKWTILIMHYLSDGPIRFNQLLKSLPLMTHATLSKQLKQLESYGLIIRTEYPQIPPKVEYELSKMGTELLPTLKQFREFGVKYIDYLNNKS